MSGFTANLSNYPPGTWAGDPQAPWNEPDHSPRCVFHEDYLGPNLACADDHYLRESDYRVGFMAGSPPACPVWYSVGERCGQPVRWVECACDQLASAYAEDAAEHAAQEDEGR